MKFINKNTGLLRSVRSLGALGLILTLALVVGLPQSLPGASQPAPIEELGVFFQGFVQLSKDIQAGMLAQTMDTSEKTLIRELGSALTEEISALSGYLQQIAAGVSEQQKSDMLSILKLSAANNVIARGQRLAKDLAPTVVKIGIGDIIKKIKKIIRPYFLICRPG